MLDTTTNSLKIQHWYHILSVRSNIFVILTIKNFSSLALILYFLYYATAMCLCLLKCIHSMKTSRLIITCMGWVIYMYQRWNFATQFQMLSPEVRQITMDQRELLWIFLLTLLQIFRLIFSVSYWLILVGLW